MKWNKFLALLLSLMMILSMATAFASEVETPGDPVGAVEEEYTEDEDVPEQPEEPEQPENPEETKDPEETEEPEQPEEPEETKDPEETEEPEQPVEDEQPAENEAALDIMALDSYQSKTVDHIDVACTGLKAKVYVNGEWKTETFSFTRQEVGKTVQVEITSGGKPVSYNRLGDSTGQHTGSQVRFEGRFPVGTIDNPTVYTVKLSKSISVDGVMVPVTLMASYHYWMKENDCPGLNEHESEWKNGKVIGGSGIDLTLSTGTSSSGSLTIVKTVEGLELTEDKEYDFEIVDASGKTVQTAKVKVSKESKTGNVIISLLPFGTYTIKEVGGNVDGYELTVDGAGDVVLSASNPGGTVNVTNRYAPSTTSVNVAKAWNDANNQDGIRPASVTVNLLADGEETGKTLTLSADNQWKSSFENLPLKKDGKEIVYTVKESEVDGYTPAVTGSAADGFTVTNTHTPETVTVSGSKTWNDNEDQDGIRPANITVNLLADGKKIDSKTVTAADWSWTFDNLPKYANGQAIVYTVAEDSVDGYESKAEGYNLVNTHTPETVTVSGSKTWNDANNQDGKRPASITVNLLANGEKVDSKTVTADDGWKWTFDNLPKYEQGTEITYAITEDKVEGYSSEINGYDVVNSYTPGKTSVNVTKVWDDDNDRDGIRPDSVTVKLLADKVDTGKILTLKAEDNWQGAFTGLDEYKDGEKIVYTVEEDEVAEGYSSNVEGYVITNHYSPSAHDVVVKKVWEDDDNKEGLRPDSIVVHLLANGVQVAEATMTVNEEGEWKYVFEEMFASENGEEIIYTVTEDPVDGYTAAVDGLVITNTREPATIDVCGKKTWDDENDADGKRPDSITIRLLADGQEIDKREVTSKDGWSWSFTALPQYADGKEIVYTITEDKVDGYTTVVKGYNVTNVHEVEDDEVPKTGDARSNMQGILLMAGLALLTIGTAFGVTAKKRGRN